MARAARPFHERSRRETPELAAVKKKTFSDVFFAPVLVFLEDIGTTVTLTTETVLWLFRRPFRVTLVVRAMEFIGVQSIFLISLTGAFSGMVLALQMVHALKSFNQQGLVGGIVAVSLTREISPVFSGLMVTARAGSALAAELGNMRVTEQIDAITTMGVNPVQYLLSPRLLASVLMLPLLCVLYTCVGIAGGYAVAVGLLNIDPGVFFDRMRQITTGDDLFMGLVKAATFGFLISAVSTRQGYFASGGARGVGLATTRAVVQSAVAILIANYIITSLLTDL
jgi:phospholipid/cholesterol/gamma-HCH transport system permease protein